MLLQSNRGYKVSFDQIKLEEVASTSQSGASPMAISEYLDRAEIIQTLSELYKEWETLKMARQSNIQLSYKVVVKRDRVNEVSEVHSAYHLVGRVGEVVDTPANEDESDKPSLMEEKESFQLKIYDTKKKAFVKINFKYISVQIPVK